MTIPSYPVSGSLSPRQLHEEFGAAVAETQTASTEWWNGVAAAMNGITLEMSFEWLEGKFCPLQFHYDEDGNPEPRVEILEAELLPYFQQTNNETAALLTETLEIFKQYKDGQSTPDINEYADDLRTAQGNLEKIVSGTPELRERQRNDVYKYMQEKLPYFPQKDGFQFNG